MAEINKGIERRILIGLIVSTEYIKQIYKIWDLRYLQTNIAKRIASWCIEYFEKYNKAPFRDIEGIYLEKLKKGQIPKDIAEEIEEEFLPDLSEEYDREEKFNVLYLIDQTKSYFKQRRLELYKEELQALLDEGAIAEAEAFAAQYKPTAMDIKVGLEIPSEEAFNKIDQAFNSETQTLISFPGALGEMWNDQFVRGAFIGIQAPEKKGKTFLLLEFAMRAVRQKANVAFFQAGDMTETQQLRRMCIYVSKKSDRQKYCGNILIPVRDCILNQLDLCSRPERECDFGILENYSEEKYWEQIKYEDLENAFYDYKEYVPCWNCPLHKENATIWYKEINIPEPLTAEEAKTNLKKFFERFKKRFKMATYPASTLSVREIKAVLNTWEQEDGFVPDVILIDYADLLQSDVRDSFRHQQNDIWMKLRGLSQERHCLIITPTQANSKSYEKALQGQSNFSEDKRKYAHVTAMYGLNQDPEGREKKLGLMRINQLVVREGEFSPTNQVYIMQKLQIGRPYLGSFFVQSK